MWIQLCDRSIKVTTYYSSYYIKSRWGRIWVTWMNKKESLRGELLSLGLFSNDKLKIITRRKKHRKV